MLLPNHVLTTVKTKKVEMVPSFADDGDGWQSCIRVVVTVEPVSDDG